MARDDQDRGRPHVQAGGEYEGSRGRGREPRGGDPSRRFGYDERNDRGHSGYGTHGSHGGEEGPRGALRGGRAWRPRGEESGDGGYGGRTGLGGMMGGMASQGDWSGTRGQGGHAAMPDPGGYGGLQSGSVPGGFEPEGGSGGWREPGRRSFGGWSAAGSMQRGPKGYRRSDTRLKDDICERIMQSDVDAGDVAIEVREGRVTLEGTIADRSMKHRLEDLVDHVIGVRDIDNRLRVGGDR